MQLVKPIIKSDSLVDLRPLFNGSGFLGVFDQIFQINLIIDANAIIADLRWLVSKRKNCNARPNLLEVLQAQTIRAFAPTFLHDEMQINIPLLASEENLSVEEFEAHWKTYKALISFIDVGGPEDGAQDPKDVPYLRLYEKLDARILSSDSDIRQMGGKIASITLVTHLRTYSRESAIEYSLKLSGAGTIYISSILLTVTGELLNSLAPHAKRVPSWVWLVCLALIISSAAHPKTRTLIKSSMESLPDRSKNLV